MVNQPMHGEVGTLQTKEMLMDAPKHPDDLLSRDARALIYDRVHAIGDYVREKTGGPRSRHHHRLWGGPKGYGKTQGSNLDAVRYTLAGGYVYSIGGLHYGYQVDKDDFYTFSESLPMGAWMFVDEVHTYTDTNANASRNQILSENDALLRKIGGRMDTTSTKEYRLPGFYLEQVDCVFYPSHYTPARVQESKITRGDGKGDWAMPPFCFVRVDALSPRPYVPETLREKHKIAPASERTRRWVKYLDPRLVYVASHLYDTWATPELGAGMLTGADDIKSALRSRQQAVEQREGLKSFYYAINVAFYMNWLDGEKSSIDYLAVVGEARKFGCEMSQKEILHLLRMKGCTTSTNRVKPKELIRQFKRPEILEMLEDQEDELFVA